MSIIIDASITVAWYFPDETTAAIEAVLETVGFKGALVPPLWRVEVANALQMSVKRKRIDKAYRAAAFVDLNRLPIKIDAEAERHIWTRTLEFSDRYGLTIYDACYFELADRHGLPLATLDKELWVAGKAHGLALLGL